MVSKSLPLRWAGAALGLAAMLLACHKKPIAGEQVAARIRPFSFQVESGKGVFQIEGYIALVGPAGKQPAVLIVNPRAGNARRCIDSSHWLNALGLQVACISMPGSGASSGPGRFIGPQAVVAVQRALKLLAHRPDVDANRLGVWGSFDGAMAVGLAMDSDLHARAVILESGTYDMVKLWSSASLLAKLKILHQVWPSHRALDERSVLPHLPPHLDLSVLILHGEHDDKSPPAQARLLEQQLKERGAYVEAYYFADGGHDLGRRVDGPVEEFLRQRLIAEK
jgi:dipeptidyl aminopeptidase/acylaminoacyl peptidase